MKIQKVFLIVFSVLFLKRLYVQAIGHRFFIQLSFYKKGSHSLINDWALFAAIIAKNAVYKPLYSLYRLTAKHYDFWPPTFGHLSLHNEILV